MERLLNYALKQNIKPDQITIVLHSGGVPTFNLTLARIDPNGGMKFKEIIMLAPNTRDVAVIANIARHSANVSLVQGKRDWALAIALWGHRPLSYWMGNLRDMKHIKFYESNHSGHSESGYIEAGIAGKWKRLR
jgi:hypothetical protein